MSAIIGPQGLPIQPTPSAVQSLARPPEPRPPTAVAPADRQRGSSQAKADTQGRGGNGRGALVDVKA